MEITSTNNSTSPPPLVQVARHLRILPSSLTSASQQGQVQLEHQAAIEQYFATRANNIIVNKVVEEEGQDEPQLGNYTSVGNGRGRVVISSASASASASNQLSGSADEDEDGDEEEEEVAMDERNPGIEILANQQYLQNANTANLLSAFASNHNSRASAAAAPGLRFGRVQAGRRQDRSERDPIGPVRLTRAKRSIVHEHFTLNEYENRYYCRHCPLSYVKTRDSSTGSLHLHLKKKHADVLWANYDSPPNLSIRQSVSVSVVPGVKTELDNSWSGSGSAEPADQDQEQDQQDNPNHNHCFQFPEIVMSSKEQDEDGEQPNIVISADKPRTSRLVQAAGTADIEIQHSSPDLVLGVIGGGQMARAILIPLFDMNVLNPSKVVVSGTSLARLEFWTKYGCTTVTDNGQLIEACNVILWAVKPQMFPKVLNTTVRRCESEGAYRGKLHISIMAGISLLHFEQMLSQSLFRGVQFRTARVNPNLGLRVKAGSSVYCLGKNATPADKDVVVLLFSQTGICLPIDEGQANAYGVLMGCGIGFMFPILEALSDGAVKAGIPREASLRLAAQTMKGAAELILQEGQHPAVLKDSVCSPGGTTISGIAELEKHGVRAAIMAAVEASTKRSFELGQLINEQMTAKK